LLPLLTVALFLGGCAVGPDYEIPAVLVPPAWGTGNEPQPVPAPKLAQWWTRFQDPMLNSLIDEAVTGNLDVATAKARIREARASYRQSVGTLFPAASGSGSATRQKSGGGASGADRNDSDDGETAPASSPISTQYQAGIDASWEIDFFGKNQRAAEAAGYGIDAAEEELRLTLLTLVGDVASNYVALRGSQARIVLAKRTAATQRQTLALTRRRMEAGAASVLDVANATGQAHATEAGIPDLETACVEAQHRLSVLTGRPPVELAHRLKRSGPIPRPRFPMPAGVPADTLLARPDVHRAERQLAQSTARIGETEAARYPSINLVGNIATSGLSLGDLAKSSSIGWSFGPTLNVPIFQGGRLRAAVEVAQAQRDQNFLAYRTAILKALEDVENALVSLSQGRIRHHRLAAAVKAYREAATLSHSLYQSGATSFLNVLDAERSLYSAEDGMLQSRITLATSYVALNKALGGGWDGLIDASRPVVIDRMGPRLMATNP
jgi:NodT family efflux transporter outer membrane factor (OMF) lipoprotein